MSLGKRLFIGGDTVSVVNTENFAPKLYTGTGASGTAITGVGFAPDFVWLKSRTVNGTSNFVFDKIRGATNWIATDLSFKQYSASGISSFDSDGFTLGSNASMNGASQNHIAWCLNAGGTSVSNTDGTTTSTVMANQDAGFSIVKTSSTSGAITFGHGLSQAPELIINKGLTTDGWSWLVYHKDVGTGKYLILNSNASTYTASSVFSSVTSSTITNNSSPSSSDYINYCFHSVDGYQKIGSFTYSAGTSVNVGFQPRFVIFKKSSGSGNWIVVDNQRVSGSTNFGLFANLSNWEDTSTNYLNLTSTGFTTTFTDTGTYIYIAIA